MSKANSAWGCRCRVTFLFCDRHSEPPSTPIHHLPFWDCTGTAAGDRSSSSTSWQQPHHNNLYLRVRPKTGTGCHDLLFHRRAIGAPTAQCGPQAPPGKPAVLVNRCNARHCPSQLGCCRRRMAASRCGSIPTHKYNVAHTSPQCLLLWA